MLNFFSVRLVVENENFIISICCKHNSCSGEGLFDALLKPVQAALSLKFDI